MPFIDHWMFSLTKQVTKHWCSCISQWHTSIHKLLVFQS